MPARINALIAAAIFAVAFLFRLIGIGWGLPNQLHNQSYHPDEQVIWQFSQGIEPAKLKFTPGFYNYGTLYLTSLRVASDITAAYTGAPDPKSAESWWDYMRRCHYAGRLMSATWGALLAVFVFFGALTYTNKIGAGLAAAAIAFAPQLVVHSRFQTTDLMATALFAASLVYSLKVLDVGHPKRLRWVVAAGILAGLSAGTKYTGMLAVLPLILAIGLGKTNSLKLIGAGIGSALTAFLLATPGALLDGEKFSRDFKYEAIHTSTGHGLLFEGRPNGFLFHFGNLLTGLGPAVVLCGLAGLALAIYRKQSWAIVLLAGFLPYYLLIGRAEVLFLRYTFPLMPIIVWGLAWLAGWAHEKSGPSRIVVGAAIVAVGMNMMISWRETSYMAEEDIRDKVANTIHLIAKDQPNTTIGLVTDPWYYTPPLIKDSAIMRGMNELQWTEMQASASPHVIQSIPADSSQRFDWDSALFDQNPDYIVFSSFEAGDLARLEDVANLDPQAKLQVDRYRAFMSTLREKYVQIWPGDSSDQFIKREGLRVHDMVYTRPVIWLWKKK